MVCVCMLSSFSCLTPCNSMGCSPPGSSVHGILQARILSGCHFLFQGIFLTQGSNLSLLSLTALVGGFFTLGKPSVWWVENKSMKWSVTSPQNWCQCSLHVGVFLNAGFHSGKLRAEKSHFLWLTQILFYILLFIFWPRHAACRILSS